MLGVTGLRTKPGNISGLADDLGCGQCPATLKADQACGLLLDPGRDPPVQRIDLGCDPLDVIKHIASHLGNDAIEAG
jgi:hypothetical protein